MRKSCKTLMRKIFFYFFLSYSRNPHRGWYKCGCMRINGHSNCSNWPVDFVPVHRYHGKCGQSINRWSVPNSFACNGRLHISYVWSSWRGGWIKYNCIVAWFLLWNGILCAGSLSHRWVCRENICINSTKYSKQKYSTNSIFTVCAILTYFIPKIHEKSNKPTPAEHRISINSMRG